MSSVPRSNPARRKKLGSRRLTEAGFQEVARKFKLLGDPARLRVLYLLKDGPMSVGDIADAVGCPQPTASRQLGRLMDGGVLRREQEGTVVYYSIADPSILTLCESVCGSIERQLQQPSTPLFE